MEKKHLLLLLMLILQNSLQAMGKDLKQILLAHTISHGDAELAQSLLSTVESQQSKDEAMQFAFDEGNITLALKILNTGANPNIALIFGAKNGLEAVVDAALNKNANPNISFEGDKIPFTVAYEGGHMPCMQLLAPKLPQEQKNHFLNRAAADGKAIIATMLLEQAADPNGALAHSAYNGHPDIMQAALNKGAQVNELYQENPPLVWAAMGGHTPTIELLLQHQADANKAGSHCAALQAAAQEGKTAAVRLLIEKCGLHDQFGNALSRASHEGHCDTARYIVDSCDPTELLSVINYQTPDGATPLIAASLRGHLAVVQYLLSLKAATDKRRTDGSTALASAAIEGHQAVVETLITANAAVTSAYPLHCAIQGGHHVIRDILLNAGAPVNTKSKGFYPLHFAATAGDCDSIQLLVNRKASPDKLSTDRLTPLCYAASEGHKAATELLLALNASSNPTNVLFSPLRCAVSRGHLTTMELLLTAGGKLGIIGNNERAYYLAKNSIPNKLAVLTLLARHDIDFTRETEPTLLPILKDLNKDDFRILCDQCPSETDEQRIIKQNILKRIQARRHKPAGDHEQLLSGSEFRLLCSMFVTHPNLGNLVQQDPSLEFLQEPSAQLCLQEAT